MKKITIIPGVLLLLTTALLHAMEPKQSLEDEASDTMVWLGCKFAHYDAWCDENEILEIAATITDKELQKIADSDTYVIKDGAYAVAASLKEKYSKSGLLARVQRSQLNTHAAEKLLLNFIQKHCSVKRPQCFIRNSIEKSFLRSCMPTLVASLSIRSLTCISIHEFLTMFNKRLIYEYPETSTAMEQAHASVAELAHYKRQLLT